MYTLYTIVCYRINHIHIYPSPCVVWMLPWVQYTARERKNTHTHISTTQWVMTLILSFNFSKEEEQKSSKDQFPNNKFHFLVEFQMHHHYQWFIRFPVVNYFRCFFCCFINSFWNSDLGNLAFTVCRLDVIIYINFLSPFSRSLC